MYRWEHSPSGGDYELWAADMLHVDLDPTATITAGQSHLGHLPDRCQERQAMRDLTLRRG